MAKKKPEWQSDHWTRIREADYLFVKEHLKNCSCEPKHKTLSSVVHDALQTWESHIAPPVVAQ